MLHIPMASISLPLVNAPAECMRALFMHSKHTHTHILGGSRFSRSRTHTIFYYIFMHSAFNRAINRSGLIISLAGEHTHSRFCSLMQMPRGEAVPRSEICRRALERISRNCIHSSRIYGAFVCLLRVKWR